MNAEVGASVEALAMLGVDYRSVELMGLDKPWHLMVDQEDKPKKKELDDHGEICNKFEDKAFDKSDIETCLYMEEHNYYFDFKGHMQDPDYMKKRLREWVKAVAAYVRLLDALPSQYLHTDIK